MIENPLDKKSCHRRIDNHASCDVEFTLASGRRFRYRGFIMKNLILLIAYLFTTFARMLRRGSTKADLAETLLFKHRLLIINRCRNALRGLSPIYLQPLEKFIDRKDASSFRLPWPNSRQVFHPEGRFSTDFLAPPSRTFP